MSSTSSLIGGLTSSDKVTYALRGTVVTAGIGFTATVIVLIGLAVLLTMDAIQRKANRVVYRRPAGGGGEPSNNPVLRRMRGLKASPKDTLVTIGMVLVCIAVASTIGSGISAFVLNKELGTH